MLLAQPKCASTRAVCGVAKAILMLLSLGDKAQAAARLQKPLLRIGFPVFDRIGNAHRVQVGYRGTMALIFEIANLMIEQIPHHQPGDWPLSPTAQRAAQTATACGAAGASAGCASCSDTPASASLEPSALTEARA
jgi:nitrogenase molybdenum-iron protein NifN